jgi:hypothetical protein
MLHRYCIHTVAEAQRDIVKQRLHHEQVQDLGTQLDVVKRRLHQKVLKSRTCPRCCPHIHSAPPRIHDIKAFLHSFPYGRETQYVEPSQASGPTSDPPVPMLLQPK